MKRIIAIILSLIVTLVLTVFMVTSTVKSKTITNSITLGNKFLLEGNYEEAIIAFEKVISIDKKNIDAKETLNILYIYEEIETLVADGDFRTAQEKLEEIKEMPKFDLIQTIVEETEGVVEKNILHNGTGNSLQNIISGGLVTYDNNYAYYYKPGSTPNGQRGESLICKRNLETDEETIVTNSEGFALYMNIYDDYIYYVKSTGPMIVKNEIVRVSKDGLIKEIVVPLEDNVSGYSIQIINNNLYYSTYKDGNSNTATEMNIMRLDLSSGEKSILYTIEYGRIRDILFTKNKKEISAYISHYNSSDNITENYKLLNLQEDDLSKITKVNEIKRVLGDVDNYRYYILNEQYTDEGNGASLIKESIQDGTSVVINDKYVSLEYAKPILGNKEIYVVANNILIGRSLETGNTRNIKKIDMWKQFAQRDEIENRLLEVNGYLAYYNNDGELIIDKSIQINRSNDLELDETVKNNLIYFDGNTIDTSNYDLVDILNIDINGDNIDDTIEAYGVKNDDFIPLPYAAAIVITDGASYDTLTSFEIDKGMYLIGLKDVIDINDDGVKDINIDLNTGGNGSQDSYMYIYDDGEYKRIIPEISYKEVNLSLLDDFNIIAEINNSNISSKSILPENIKSDLIKKGYCLENGKLTDKKLKFMGFKEFGYTISESQDGVKISKGIIMETDARDLFFRLNVSLYKQYKGEELIPVGIDIEWN